MSAPVPPRLASENVPGDPIAKAVGENGTSARDDIRSVSLPLVAMVALAAVMLSSVVHVFSNQTTPITLIEPGPGAARNTLRTTVLGDPFATRGFPRTVTQLMTAVSDDMRIRFVPTSGDAVGTESADVIIAFNPTPDIDPELLCRGWPVFTDAGRRPIVVRAAYCADGGAQFAMTGTIAGARNPRDLEFIEMITDLTHRLSRP